MPTLIEKPTRIEAAGNKPRVRRPRQQRRRRREHRLLPVPGVERQARGK
jgi:hypothetical protein